MTADSHTTWLRAESDRLRHVVAWKRVATLAAIVVVVAVTVTGLRAALAVGWAVGVRP